MDAQCGISGHQSSRANDISTQSSPKKRATKTADLCDMTFSKSKTYELSKRPSEGLIKHTNWQQ
jgi:hypothetical protein